MPKAVIEYLSKVHNIEITRKLKNLKY